jgi:hypothetical protein
MEIQFEIGKGHFWSVVKWILWPVGLIMWAVTWGSKNPSALRETSLVIGLIGGGFIGVIAGLGCLVIGLHDGVFPIKCFITFWACASAFFGSLKWIIDNE